VLHGRETGRIVRTAEGKFFEVHEALGEHERWRLVQHETLEPLELRASVDSNGVRRSGALMDRARATVSSFYFSNRIPAVTPAELTAAHHDGAAHEALATTPASPKWEGQLHGGADERAETDAYAPHAHEDGEAREAEPEAETTATR
jgi:ubiquinol-cytochrome c reductase cytochrome b subunit